jgi:hypothetical protein
MNIIPTTMNEPRTSKPEYGLHILKALEGRGEATVDEALEETFRLIEPRLHPADLEQLPGGVPRWRRQAENMLEGLIEEGYVAESHGCLTLTRRGLDYLSGS